MFCSRCGRRNTPGNRFCESCSAALDVPGAEQSTQPHSVLGSDVETEAPVPPPSRSQPALIVRRGATAGKRYILNSGPVTIGRSPAADIFLNDVTVSREHATLVCDDYRCVVNDEGSLNGTYLNGKRIESESALVHGDELQIGTFKFVYFDRKPIDPG